MEKRKKASLQKTLVNAERLATVLSLVFFAGIIGKWDLWFWSIATSFAWQVHLVILAFGMYLLVRQHVRPATLNLLCATIIHVLLVPTDSHNLPFGSDVGTELRIAHFNVLKSNTDHQSTIRAALESNADFLSFQEINAGWAEDLSAGLGSAYPYHIIRAQESCCFGIAVFSRIPISNGGILYFQDIPNLTGTLCLDTGEVQFITLHTKAPTTPENHARRNAHIRFAERYLQSIPGPKIAIGDFNSVPWDGSLHSLRKNCGLADSRKNVAATYPSFAPVLRVPIDHILHSRHFRCLEFDTITTTSSDHLGVFGRYRISV